MPVRTIGTKVKGSSDVKINHVGKSYYDAMVQVSNELEKLDNSKLPEYTKFFIDITNNKTKFDGPEINALTNKINELNRDKDLENIDRPIDDTMIETLCNMISQTSSEFLKVKISTGTSISDVLSVTELTNSISLYNQIIGLMTSLGTIIKDEKRHYSSVSDKCFAVTEENIRKVGFRIKSLSKIMKAENAAVASMIPEISQIQC